MPLKLDTTFWGGGWGGIADRVLCSRTIAQSSFGGGEGEGGDQKFQKFVLRRI